MDKGAGGRGVPRPHVTPSVANPGDTNLSDATALIVSTSLSEAKFHCTPFTTYHMNTL